MSQQQHTPEPMFQYEYRQLATYEDGRTPALLTEEQYRRARACVNACAGIPTEELERQCSSRYIVSKTDLVRMVNEATKQRDMLLAALEYAHEQLVREAERNSTDVRRAKLMHAIHLSEEAIASVNACAGVSTESLEEGGVGSVLSLGLEEQKRGDIAEKQRDMLLAEKRKVNVTLTGKDIRELAELAGLVIEDNDYTDEYGAEITVKSFDGHLLSDDGEEEHYRLIAYFTDYPDEGAIGLGDKIEPEAIASVNAFDGMSRPGIEIAELVRQRDVLLEALEGLTDDIQGLIDESSGVYGLHMNGDLAHWSDIEAGGRFERLTHLPIAQKAIASVKGGV